jgi:hypothetical protein
MLIKSQKKAMLINIRKKKNANKKKLKLSTKMQREI